MAYSTGNPPALIAGKLGTGPRLWLYASSDPKGTVTGSTYITNGRDLGMQKNDLIHSLDNKTNVWISAQVLSTSTNGSVTLSTSTVIASSK